ncbi:MAG: methyltransferase family protein [Rhodocyclaceae bacterium]
MANTLALSWLALGWVAYALIHSLLASLTVKAWVTRFMPAFAPWYRLTYNLVATLLVLPLAWATLALPGEWLWRWTGIGAWAANSLAASALIAFWFASSAYDMGEFLGLRPLKEKRADATGHDAFRISPLHRFIRHPWYCLALVLIWTRDMNAPKLVSATAITLYLIIGARLEERKLEAHYGAAYRQYRQRVPGLLPLPWKRLSAAEAKTLMECARHRQHEF